MKYYIILTISLFSAIAVQAQEVDLSDKTITWNCTSFTDLIANNQVDGASQLITNQSSITWIQGDFKQEFTIVNSNWQWNENKKKVMYKVELHGSKGEFVIESTKNHYVATIVLEKGAEKYRLAIDNYTY